MVLFATKNVLCAMNEEHKTEENIIFYLLPPSLPRYHCMRDSNLEEGRGGVRSHTKRMGMLEKNLKTY